MRIKNEISVVPVVLLLTRGIECMQLRSRQNIEQHRFLEDMDSAYNATDLEYNITNEDYNFSHIPTIVPTSSVNYSAPLVPSAAPSSIDSQDTTSNSSDSGISDLEFAIGFLILALSCLVVACITAAIKTNTTCYEDQLAGKEQAEEFEDSLDDSTHSRDGTSNPIALSGIRRSGNRKLMQSNGSGGSSAALKRGAFMTSRYARGGPEFVKLQHFEQQHDDDVGDGSANYDGDEDESDVAGGGARFEGGYGLPTRGRGALHAHKRLSTR